MKGCSNHDNSLYNSNIFTISRLEMGCYRMRCWDGNAISEMISLVLVLMIVTGAITAIMMWGVPYMETQKIAVRWESSLLQLDVMGDIVEDVFSEGIGSSKKMNFQTSEGQFHYDVQGGRFVIYYSVYTDYDLSNLPNSYTENRFDFDVRFTDDVDSFFINVNSSDIKHLNGNSLDLNFTAIRLDGSATESTGIQSITLDTETEINFTVLELSDAVKIEIACDPPGAPVGDYIDYGRIWLFDVGTFVYRAVGFSDDHRVIIENGAVIAAHSDSGYMYNEPLYWSQKLLDGNSMMNIRIIQMKENKDIGINASGGGGFTTEAIITSNNSTALVNRYPISYPLRMKIYGDEAAVYAWNFYYNRSVGFEEVVASDGEPGLEIGIENPNLPEDVKNLWFSLNHAIYKIGMEVKI